MAGLNSSESTFGSGSGEIRRTAVRVLPPAAAVRVTETSEVTGRV